MLKPIMKKLVYILLILIIFICYSINIGGIFSSYEPSSYNFYLYHSNSNCKILSVTPQQAHKTVLPKKALSGQDCHIPLSQFNMDKFLSDFNAVFIETQVTDSSVSYYYYSNKIDYKTSIKGETVNLHIAFLENEVVVGSPIIFASF